MKILLVWGEYPSEMRLVFDAFLKHGHEIVYWVGGVESADLCPEGVPFHDFYDAWAALPAKSLENERIDPAGTDLIDSMNHLESHLLTMMNKRYNNSNVDERKHIYFTMLAYWSFVLERFKPDCVVHNVIPHSIFANIIDELAKKRGIHRICMEDTWIGAHTLVYRDFWKGNEELRLEMKKLEHSNVSANDLCDELRDYWNAQIKKGPTEPIYMVEQKKFLSGRGLAIRRIKVALRALRRGNLPQLVAGYIVRLFKRDLTVEYSEVTKEPDWNVPYVYFPLSFQPERLSSPQGLLYADLLLAAETLAAALPEGWELWVKEHPSQWLLRSTRYSSVRYPGYYHRLASIPRVRVVPITTDTFKLTEKSSAVAVTTGSAGWEALLKGKRPLMFGIPWWRDCPGVYKVNDTVSCRQAFEEIKNGAQSSQKDILRFLVAVDRVSIHSRTEFFDFDSFKERREDNRDLGIILDRICKELKAIET